MPSWILVPALVSLRNEFNTLAPARDKTSDGSIGDARHASSSSDHNPDETGATPYEDADNLNEVHAVDVDVDLRKAGWTMARAVAVIVTRHRNGTDDRLQNVIYNRRIWSRSWGWTAREYTGSNPHDKHAHFSNRYTTAQEKNTKPWGLLAADKPVPPKPGYPNVPVHISGRHEVKEGHRGTDVVDVQRKVGIDADGLFGPKTTQAVKNWQNRRKLTVDGIVGPRTWKSFGY